MTQTNFTSLDNNPHIKVDMPHREPRAQAYTNRNIYVTSCTKVFQLQLYIMPNESDGSFAFKFSTRFVVEIRALHAREILWFKPQT